MRLQTIICEINFYDDLTSEGKHAPVILEIGRFMFLFTKRSQTW